MYTSSLRALPLNVLLELFEFAIRVCKYLIKDTNCDGIQQIIL